MGADLINETSQQSFLKAAETWVCDGYHVDIRFLAGNEGGKLQVWDAAITLNPLPPQHDYNFLIKYHGFVVGQVQRDSESKEAILGLLRKAVAGVVETPEGDLTLFGSERLSFYTEMADRERWFSDLHLRVGGGRSVQVSPSELVAIDTALRRSNPPFDGLMDVTSWLNLTSPGSSANSAITIRVSPPADLLLDKAELSNDLLRLSLVVHPQFDVRHLGLAIRTVPGDGLKGRVQAADQIVWAEQLERARRGVAAVKLQNAENALVMLTIDD